MKKHIAPVRGNEGMAKDACYRKAKARYKVFPSAYASGAIAKCRKVGAANWGNKGKKKTRRAAAGGITEQRAKRPFRGNLESNQVVARGCGGVMNGRRKKTRCS